METHQKSRTLGIKSSKEQEMSTFKIQIQINGLKPKDFNITENRPKRLCGFHTWESPLPLTSANTDYWHMREFVLDLPSSPLKKKSHLRISGSG